MTLQQPTNIDHFSIALFAAVCVHTFVILGISFDLEKLKRPDQRQQNLEVILVHQPPETTQPTDNPDFLAQASQQGGGEQQTPERPLRESHTATNPLPPNQPAPAKPAELPQQQSIQINKARQTTRKPPTSAQLLASRKIEIARLTAELEQQSRAYAKLPKRKAISASTREYKYAAYLEAWRRKVERTGNLNYPDKAKRQRLYGSLILHVAVNADGSVEQTRILRSSGHKILDDAALRIVRIASPFSPFPKEIREEADILDITRTWQFLPNGKLNSQ